MFMRNFTALSFIHIPKTAGASLVKDTRHAFPHFYPRVMQGEEHGSLYDRAQRPNSAHLVMLRSPRAHVVSQYAECRYDRWGMKVTTPEFPRSRSFEEDFEKWIVANKSFNCYHPDNMQTRYLSSSSRRPHDYELPSLSVALSQLRSMDWIGIVEFYQESLCSLVPKKCSQSVAHERHYRHKPSFHNISSRHHDLIDQLTRLDKLLYLEGLQLFFRNVRLSQFSLDRAQPQLAYLHPNITQLYHSTRETLR